MWPLSARAQAAVRSAPRFRVLVTVWSGGVQRAVLQPEGGSVRFTAGTGTRAELTLTVKETAGAWEALRPGGVELRATYQVVFLDGQVEDVPLGRFYLTTEAQSAGEGFISLTAPDLWAKVLRARFEVPSTLQGPARDVATRFVQQALPGVPVRHRTPGSVYVAGQVFDRDRDQAVRDLLTSDGLEGYLYRDGAFETRAVPSLYGPAVWFLRGGDRGVLVSADRERSVEQVRNVQVVNPAGPHVWKPPVVAEDRNPLSPSRVDGDMGRAPAFFASPLIRSREQAAVVARARLRRSTGMAASVGLSAITNPALDPGDVITVSVQGRPGTQGWNERHIVDSVTVPFDGSPQTITTRSAVAAESGDQTDGVVVT